MATFNRTDFIATCGNRGLKKGGVQLFPCSGAGCDTPYNLYGGEFVVYNPRTGVTYGIADLPNATHIAMGVGVGEPTGLATGIVHVFGSQGKTELCDLKIKANVTPPCCGIPQIVDVFFDCVKCDKVYTLEVLLDDSLVRSRYNTNERAKYNFQAVTECCNCADCEPEANCTEVVCKLVDAINGTVQKDISKITRFVKANLSNQYQPFSASRLFLQDKDGGDKTSHVFCLGVSDTDCKRCAFVDGITGFEIDGVAHNFEFTTLPEDPTKSSHGQIKRAICEINLILETVGGSAKLQRGVGRCCPYSLEINTCGIAPKLLTSTGPVDPKISRSPFTSKQIEQICKGCGITPDKIKLGCGLRLFVDPIEVPCNCLYPDNLAAPNMYIRNIEAQFVGDGWVCKNFHSFTSQKSERPEGFGYYWEQEAVSRQYSGGPSRDFRYSNFFKGKVVPLPDSSSNFTNASKGIKCPETYCAFNLLSQRTRKGFFSNALSWTNCDVIYLLVPDKDDKTLCDVTDVLAVLQKLGTCIPGNVICMKAASDVVDTPDTVGTAATVDTTVNDPDFASKCAGDLVWSFSNAENVTVVNNEDGTFEYTALACGVWSFKYTVSCTDADGKVTVISSSSVSGTAEEA